MTNCLTATGEWHAYASVISDPESLSVGLFIPFSSQIEKSRKAYYDAFTAVGESKNYSGKIDVTPFILYFINNVYKK